MLVFASNASKMAQPPTGARPRVFPQFPNGLSRLRCGRRHLAPKDRASTRDAMVPEPNLQRVHSEWHGPRIVAFGVIKMMTSTADPFLRAFLARPLEECEAVLLAKDFQWVETQASPRGGSPLPLVPAATGRPFGGGVACRPVVLWLPVAPLRSHDRAKRLRCSSLRFRLLLLQYWRRRQGHHHVCDNKPMNSRESYIEGKCSELGWFDRRNRMIHCQRRCCCCVVVEGEVTR
mmetsp:Transcript_29705/g.81625  ORF Transcript_29705/g.81625 Transcript_29705/m.81625 type:complete len:233 (+) Transcript_29705:718-1416(+)